MWMKLYDVTVEMKLFSSTFTSYYLFGMSFELMSLWMKSYGVTIQMKSLQQYFHMVLFI